MNEFTESLRGVAEGVQHFINGVEGRVGEADLGCQQAQKFVGGGGAVDLESVAIAVHQVHRHAERRPVLRPMR